MMSDLSLLTERFHAVVVGARVGDAMGTPTEAMTPQAIDEKFGWVTQFAGQGTDDSMMATLLSRMLTRTGGTGGADEWAAEIRSERSAILAQRDKFFPSVLHLVEKLDSGVPPRRVCEGNMPSTSAAMCIWPVGLVNAGDPRAAATQAYAVAELIHPGDIGFCADAAAAVAAAVATGLRAGVTVEDVVDASLEAIKPESGEEMRTLIEDAIALARSSGDYSTFRESYGKTFSRRIFCDSRETVPAAFALFVLAEGDLRTAVEYGANFGRDTDTIASMAGAVAGAFGGTPPPTWLSQMSDTEDGSAREVAAALASVTYDLLVGRLRAASAVEGLDVVWPDADHV